VILDIEGLGSFRPFEYGDLECLCWPQLPFAAVSWFGPASRKRSAASAFLKPWDNPGCSYTHMRSKHEQMLTYTY
jgi:hypothetical protein